MWYRFINPSNEGLKALIDGKTDSERFSIGDGLYSEELSYDGACIVELFGSNGARGWSPEDSLEDVDDLLPAIKLEAQKILKSRA